MAVHGVDSFSVLTARKPPAYSRPSGLSTSRALVRSGILPTLSFSYHFPSMVFGADLLAAWPGFSVARQDAFRRFYRETALPLNTMDRDNNWGNWGLVLVLACARHLGDDELLNRGERRWKELLDRQIDDHGHPQT